MRRVKPDVVVGLGGYITFSGGMMPCCAGKPWCCTSRTRGGHGHKVLAGLADRVFTPSPTCLKRASGWATRCAPPFTSSPARPNGLQAAAARCACWWWAAAWARASTRSCPQAIALMPADQRPTVSTKAVRGADRCPARQLRRRGCRGRADAFHRRHRQRVLQRPTSSSAGRVRALSPRSRPWALRPSLCPSCRPWMTTRPPTRSSW